MNTRVVTTSWDDGDPLDLKLAELLQSKQIPATFYVPVRASFRPQVLSRPQLRSLSSTGFEIGSHGVTETPLKGLSSKELDFQIGPCRPFLEDIVGCKVRMFCYVRGSHDANTVAAVKAAGFSGARTVRMLSTSPVFDSFEMPTTIQSFPHPRSTYFRNAVKGATLERLRASLVHLPDLLNWVQLGKKMFDSMLENGGIWHLYGHSWEIERLGLWHELAELLDYIGHRPGVIYASNGDVVERRFVQTAMAVAPAAVPEIPMAQAEEPTKTVEAGL